MIITAAEWISRSSVDSAVLERWPDYRVTLVATDHVDVEALAVVADQMIAEATDFARCLDPTASDGHVARWHGAFRDFGVKPRVARVSIDALLRRATSDSGLPRINVLVDLYNAISVLHHVPIGGEDLDRYLGAARLTLATGHEDFHTNANGEPVVEHPDPGEPIWADDHSITCRRWNWRQTTRTAIQPDTRRVGFIIDSLDGPHHDSAHRVAARLADLIGNTHTRTIDRSTR